MNTSLKIILNEKLTVGINELLNKNIEGKE